MKNVGAKVLSIILVLMLAVMALPACSTGADESEPEVKEEPPAAEEQVEEETADDASDTDETADDASDTDEADAAAYEPDKLYILKTTLRVRDEPSADSRQKKRSELAEADMIKAAAGDDAALKAGAKVNCLEVSGDWMRIESGWICCREGEDVYITEPIELMPPEDGDWTYEKGYYYDEEGEKFFITETDEALTGSYKISGINGDSISFESGGRCNYHTEPGAGSPQFDENGVCDGNYNYRDGKVYFRLGGTMNVEVYKIEEGELVQQ